MATSTNEFNDITSFGDADDPANKESMEVSTTIVSKTDPRGHVTNYRPANKPVEKIALAELLVKHDNEQPESVSEIQRNNLNLVRRGNRTRLERGRAVADTRYVDTTETNYWVNRFLFAIILICLLGLFLYSYRLQNYSNELRLPILSLEERISANNLPSPDRLPAQNVLTEINEKYLILEKKVSEIAKADISGKIPVRSLGSVIEQKDDALYQTLEKRLVIIEQQLSKQPSEPATRIDSPVLVEKKSIAQDPKQIDKTLTTNPVADHQGWVVNLLSFKTMRFAKKVRNKFAKKGIYTQTHQININGNRWYRLRAVGFPTRRKAVEFGDSAKSTLGLKTYWLAFE